MSSRATRDSGAFAVEADRPHFLDRVVQAVKLHAWQTGALVTVLAICLTVIVQVEAPTAQAQPPTADLVGYWSMNEGAGPAAADASSLGHNGTLVSGPTWVPGKSGTALAFSGTAYLAVGDIPQIKALGAVTLSAWMKRSATSAMVLVGKQTSGHDLAIETWGDGRVYFDVSNGSYADGYIVLNDTAWHHYTLVFNGQVSGNSGRLKAYVDGLPRTLTYEGTIPSATTSNSTPFNLSKLQGDYSNGSVDEVRLYARALTSDEVRSLIDLPPAPPPAPTVTSVAPANGPAGGGTAATITGTGFATGAGATTVAFGAALATGVNCASTTSCTVTSPAGTGTVDITVTVNGLTSTTNSGDRFSYVSPPPPPTATSVAPASSTSAGGTAVTIGGTGFTSGAGVTFDGIAATGVTVTSAGSVSATTPAHAAGVVNVTVTNTDGQTGTCASCFTYANGAPTVTSVAPATGPTAGGTAVTLTGTGFDAATGGTTVSFGIPSATAVSCTSTTSCSATSPAGTGTVDVTVAVAGVTSGASAADRFTYVSPPPPAPTATSIAPATGPTGGGTVVSITGAGLASGATVTFGGAPASAVSVANANAMSATAPAHVAGIVNVTVTNPDGQSGTCAGCFSYEAATSAKFPLTLSSNRRYLVDNTGVPFRIQGEAAWSMMANLTYSEANTYLSDRRAKGFNTVIANLLEHRFAVNAPANRNGDQPFTSAGNFATPNEAYFAFVDSMIDLAASKDIAVMLSYMYLGNNSPEGWWSELNNGLNTQAVCYEFGRYLGNRYRDRANIIWVAGGDLMPGAGTEGEARLHKIMEGIQSVGGASKLHTAHWVSDSVSSDERAFANALSLNAAYAYGTTYQMALRAYSYAPPVPSFLIETGYEAEGWSPGDPASVRRYEYGAYLFAIGGLFYGHRDIWEFATDNWWSGFAFGHQRWQLSLDAPGALDMVRMDELLDSLPWWNLVPSNTAGMKRIITGGGGFSGSSSYVVAAATPDGAAMLAYVPPTGTGPRTITVDMSVMGGAARARWFNPTSGSYIAIAASLPNAGMRQFTTPGNNGTGTNDWVLVLDRG